MSVRIIATGGTFDKHYDPIRGELGFGHTHLDQIVARARLAQRVEVDVTMLLDSLEMTDALRAQVVDACRRAPEKRIVVVHGTDTMTLTAHALALAALPKAIVLTGAMVPYCIEGSDAVFNLGFAMGCVQALNAGVHIAMNGQLQIGRAHV